jgi:hypothetical protein
MIAIICDFCQFSAKRSQSYEFDLQRQLYNNTGSLARFKNY